MIELHCEVTRHRNRHLCGRPAVHLRRVLPGRRPERLAPMREAGLGLALVRDLVMLMDGDIFDSAATWAAAPRSSGSAYPRPRSSSEGSARLPRRIERSLRAHEPPDLTLLAVGGHLRGGAGSASLLARYSVNAVSISARVVGLDVAPAAISRRGTTTSLFSSAVDERRLAPRLSCLVRIAAI